MRVGSLDEGLRIEVDAKDIRYFGEGEEFHSRVVDLFQFFFREMAGFLVDVDVVQYRTGLLGDALPCDKV
ncbi:Uncharacterised protein [Bacteroides xylanisolvens]|nr:Uncharacterised protein [Bacteroides xylanisolvens]